MREHHWDVARVGLMLLGIPYHVAWLYGPPLDWSGDWAAAFAPSPDRSVLLWDLLIAIHLFRMPAFFLIAGYFSVSTLTRYDRRTWLWKRLMRLGPPCLFGVTLLVPLGLLFRDAALLSTGAGIGAIGQAVLDSYRAERWVVYGHIWFLVVLIYCTLLIALAAPMVRRAAAMQSTLLATLDPLLSRPVLLALILYGGLFLYHGAVKYADHHWHIRALEPMRTLLLWSLIDYLPWFLIGGALALLAPLRDAFLRHNMPLTIAAVAVTPLAMADGIPPLAGWFMQMAAALLLTRLWLSSCRSWAGVPNRTTRLWADRAFTIYLIHIPVIFCCAFLFIGVPLPVLARFVAVTLLTVAVSFCIAGLAGSGPWLAWLLGGDVRQATDEAKAAHGAGAGPRLTKS